MDEEELRKRIEELEKTLEDHEARLSQLERQRNKVGNKKEEKLVTLPKFMKGKTIQYHKDKALRIGYFLDVIKGQGTFTSKDIEEGYKKCRFKLPANMNDILNKMSKKDFLMEVNGEEEMKNWQLTKNGINRVEKENENE